MPRLLLPPLSADAANYFESIIGRASAELDLGELNEEQLEQLLVVLEGETEHVSGEMAMREASEVAHALRPISDLAAALTCALAERQRGRK